MSGKSSLMVLARENRRGSGERHDQIRTGTTGEGGANEIDHCFFRRTHKPGLTYGELNVVDRSSDAPIQVEPEVAGEMIEYEIAAVERLQHQDLAHRRLRSARPRCERQQAKQRGNRTLTIIRTSGSTFLTNARLQPSAPESYRQLRAMGSNQRSDMQESPASILAISETWSGTTVTP